MHRRFTAHFRGSIVGYDTRQPRERFRVVVWAPCGESFPVDSRHKGEEVGRGPVAGCGAFDWDAAN